MANQFWASRRPCCRHACGRGAGEVLPGGPRPGAKEVMSLDCSHRFAWERGCYTDRCPKNERKEETMCKGRKLALLAGVALVLGLAPMLPASADVVFNERI